MKILNPLFVVLLLLFSTINTLIGQEMTFKQLDSIKTKKIDDILVNKSIKQILIFEKGCVGCEVINPDMCECNFGYRSIYLIWETPNGSNILEFNCCGELKTRSIDISSIWEDLKLNGQKYFSSEFKTEFYTSHYTFYNLELVNRSDKQKIDFYSYYFDSDNEYLQQNKAQPANRLKNRLIAMVNL